MSAPDFDALNDKANHEHSLLEQEAEREMEEGEQPFIEWLIASGYHNELWSLFAAVEFPTDAHKDQATSAAALIRREWMDYRPHAFSYAEENHILDKGEADDEKARAEDRAAEDNYYGRD
jgi:hypothetical protein